MHTRSKLLVSFTICLGALLAGCAGPGGATTKAPTTSSSGAKAPPAPLAYAVGADLSFLGQAEARGVQFKDQGVVKPGLQIFRDHGYNWIRLRLFHTPTMVNNLDYTIDQAQKAKALGYKFLLSIHYSDSWADPGKQPIPKAWQGKSHAELVQAVEDYTRDTMVAFRTAGAMPDMVQVGNEITNGMLWPDGKLPENWDNFADLIKAGIRGMDAGLGDAQRPRLLTHVERPARIGLVGDFFDNLIARGVEVDIIGTSYYPWWHGSLLQLRDGLAYVAEKYRREIIVVEAAYNSRPAEYRNTPPPFPGAARILGGAKPACFRNTLRAGQGRILVGARRRGSGRHQ